MFSRIITGLILGLSTSLTLASYQYENQVSDVTTKLSLSDYISCQNVLYLACKDPTYEKPSIGYWTLPIYHPFHLVSVIIFFAYIVMARNSYFFTRYSLVII